MESQKDLISWSDLPDLVLDKIFSCLPLEDRLNASRVCHSWSNVLSSASLWSTLISVFYGDPLKAQESIYRDSVAGHYQWIPILKGDTALEFPKRHAKHIKWLDLVCDPIRSYKSGKLQETVAGFLSSLTKEGCDLRKLIVECCFHSTMWEAGAKEEMINSFIDFIQNQHHLKSIMFHFIPKDDDVRLLEAIVQSSGKTLEYLVFVFYYFPYPNNLVQEIFYEALCKMPFLTYIQLSLESLDDVVVKNLTEHCPNIRTIDVLAKITVYRALGVSAETWRYACKLRPRLQVQFDGVLPLRYSMLPVLMPPAMPLSTLDLSVRRSYIPEMGWNLSRCIQYINESFKTCLVDFSFVNCHISEELDENIKALVISCPKLKYLTLHNKISVATIKDICNLQKENKIALKLFRIDSRSYTAEETKKIHEAFKYYEDMIRSRDLNFYVINT